MNNTKTEFSLPNITELIKELRNPVHLENIVDPERKIDESEADLSAGYFIKSEIAELVSETALSDFREFMKKSLSVPEDGNGYPIELKVSPNSFYNSQDDSFSISIDNSGCVVTCPTSEGVRRALLFVEDEMTIRRAAILPHGHWERTMAIQDRIFRSPLAAFEYSQLGEELLDFDLPDPYPEEYLSKMSHMGANAIWVNGTFGELIATKAIPELGPAESRLDKLVNLIEKSDRYGIKVFFFYMEPRLTLNETLLSRYPDIRGARFPNDISLGEYAICTSSLRVQDYLREAMVELFTKAPGLAGVIEIFHGERGTNCWMTGENVKHPEKGCPRCADIPVWEGLAAKLNCLYDGIKSVAPEGKLLAWDYTPSPEKLKAIPFMNKNIIWLSCFEHGGLKKIKDKVRVLDEYSLSYAGPTDIYRKTKELLDASGMKLYSKIQVGTTYELPSQPYIPVPSCVYRKFQGMYETGTTGTMLNWVIGGYPSMMFKTAGESCFLPLDTECKLLQRIAAISWGEKHASTVVKAWKFFDESFSLYPMNNEVFYHGPITRSPAYHLNLEKETGIAWLYNWGLRTFDRQQIQPYEDDPTRWTGTFTVKEVIDSFREMAEIWGRGVEILRSLAKIDKLRKDPFFKDMKKQVDVAEGVWIQLTSCANVIEFYTLKKAVDEARFIQTKAKTLQRMKSLLLDDSILARKMRQLLEVNPFMGFHSEMFGYSVSPALIDEKIRNDQETLRKIEKILERESKYLHKGNCQTTFRKEAESL